MRMIGQSARSTGTAAAKSGGAASRMIVLGATVGSHSAGLSAAKMSGSHGKGEAPSPGRYLRRHRGGGVRRMAHQLAILCPIVDVAAEELLCEPGKVESAWSRGALFPLLHPRPPLSRGE